MQASKLAVIAMVLTAGCGGQNTGSVQPQSGGPGLLTRAELQQSSQRSKDLYEAVRSLRPNFINPLTTRSQGNQDRSLPRPTVFVNGTLSGELEVMKGIMTENVQEVRFMSPSEASVEYGSRAPGGAILVTLRKDVGKP